MMMKDLMVVVDDSAAAESTFAYAVSMAKAFEAHLAVLYPVPVLPPAVYMGIEYSTEWLAAISDNLDQNEQTAKKKYLEKAEAADIEIEWRTEEGEPSQVVTEQSRYVDMTIITQSMSDEEENASRNLSGHFLLETGRPVLIVPHIGATPGLPKNVLVAWDDSRTSTRALNDAMPLLSSAESVQLFTINSSGKTRETKEVSAIDISKHLARHGINVETRVLVATDIDPADLLLSHVADMGNDLIVMGAYGHSRLRELVLGGMTREILQSMTVPVLMSH
ncbi:MAG: universal stress protein [Gammaproteobacteria bacterium]|jgi:nucleotide-binding universal stress UspA family protein